MLRPFVSYFFQYTKCILCVVREILQLALLIAMAFMTVIAVFVATTTTKQQQQRQQQQQQQQQPEVTSMLVTSFKLAVTTDVCLFVFFAQPCPPLSHGWIMSKMLTLTLPLYIYIYLFIYIYINIHIHMHKETRTYTYMYI